MLWRLTPASRRAARPPRRGRRRASVFCTTETSDRELAARRQLMVDRQIAARDVKDAPRPRRDAQGAAPSVRAAWRSISRAYDDTPLPIGYDQTISQPFIVALHDRSARRRALATRCSRLARDRAIRRLCWASWPRSVYTDEIVPELARQAAATLKSLGYAQRARSRRRRVCRMAGTCAIRSHHGHRGARAEIPKPLLDQLGPQAAAGDSCRRAGRHAVADDRREDSAGCRPSGGRFPCASCRLPTEPCPISAPSPPFHASRPIVFISSSSISPRQRASMPSRSSSAWRSSGSSSMYCASAFTRSSSAIAGGNFGSPPSRSTAAASSASTRWRHPVQFGALAVGHQLRNGSICREPIWPAGVLVGDAKLLDALEHDVESPVRRAARNA